MKAGGKKNALDREIGADGKREWSFGLFDCFNACNVCMPDRPIQTAVYANTLFFAGCLATLCPCVVFSRNRQRLHSLQDQGAPLPDGSERCIKDCINGCFIPHGTATHNRSNIRDRYDIRGSHGGDCLTLAFCIPCALTQERREIELEEKSLK